MFFQSLMSRHHSDAQVALQQCPILQNDNIQVNIEMCKFQDRSVICQISIVPFTQLNEHSPICIFTLTALEFTKFIPFALMIKLFGAIIIGGISANFSNPLSKKNKSLLINSGWKYGYKLPSPLLLNWPEYLVIISFILCGMIEYYFISFNSKLDFVKYLPMNMGQYLNSITLALIYLVIYIFDCFRSISFRNYPVKSIVTFLLTTFIVFPHYNIFISIAVIVVQYILVYQIINDTLKGFPWNDINWKYNQSESIQKFSWMAGLNKTVWSGLSPVQFNKPISTKISFILSCIFGWTGFVSCKFISPLFEMGKTDPKNIGGIVIMGYSYIFLLGIISYLVNYMSLCRPPLSIIGRITQKKLIIPDYDIIFLAPLCSIACLTLSIPLLILIDSSLACGICGFSALFCLLAIGPDFETWFYTGNYNVINLPPNTQLNAQQKNTNQKKILTISEASKPQDEKLLEKLI